MKSRKVFILVVLFLSVITLSGCANPKVKLTADNEIIIAADEEIRVNIYIEVEENEETRNVHKLYKEVSVGGKDKKTKKITMSDLKEEYPDFFDRDAKITKVNLMYTSENYPFFALPIIALLMMVLVKIMLAIINYNVYDDYNY